MPLFFPPPKTQFLIRTFFPAKRMCFGATRATSCMYVMRQWITLRTRTLGCEDRFPFNLHLSSLLTFFAQNFECTSHFWFTVQDSPCFANDTTNSLQPPHLMVYNLNLQCLYLCLVLPNTFQSPIYIYLYFSVWYQ